MVKLLQEVLEGEPLSEREIEVMGWAARGLTSEQTGKRIFLAPETVKGYRKRAIAKLGAQSLTHAVALLVDLGVVTPHSGAPSHPVSARRSS